MKPKKSIMTEDFDSCFLCGMVASHIHHVYGGNGRRNISDREGFIVPLCVACHTGDQGVHHNRRKDLILKQECEQRYLDLGHSRRDFIKLIGRNYL